MNVHTAQPKLKTTHNFKIYKTSISEHRNKTENNKSSIDVLVLITIPSIFIFRETANARHISSTFYNKLVIPQHLQKNKVYNKLK